MKHRYQFESEMMFIACIFTVEWGPTLSAERKVYAESRFRQGLLALDLLKNGCDCTGFYV